MKKSHFIIYLLVGAALCWAAPCVVEADVVSSVALGNQEPVKDAIGRNLPGNWERPDIASRVEIRSVGTGIVAPDPQTGKSDEANPLVALSFIGENMIGANLGKFSHTLSDRSKLAGGAFARVYDHRAPQDATYYWDSQVIQDVPENEWEVERSLDVIFGARQVIDTVNYPGDPDTDGDGIPDAMEIAEFGTNKDLADTDGDGYDDLFEVLYGQYLQPIDADPSLTIELTREVAPEGSPPEPTFLSWDTIPVPDMEYVVQFRPIWEDEEAFTNITNIWGGAGTNERIELDVQEWLDESGFERGFFRVRVPYERP